VGVAAEQRPDQAHIVIAQRLDQVHLEWFRPARRLDHITGAEAEIFLSALCDLGGENGAMGRSLLGSLHSRNFCHLGQIVVYIMV